MTLDEARENMGARVCFEPRHSDRIDWGTLIDIRPPFAIVAFGPEGDREAVRAEDIHLTGGTP